MAGSEGLDRGHVERCMNRPIRQATFPGRGAEAEELFTTGSTQAG